MSTAFWIAWVLMFAFGEYQGLRDPADGTYTFTNRVRKVMAANPVLRQIMRGGIAVGLAWLTWHFLGVDPALHPGAFLQFP